MQSLITKTVVLTILIGLIGFQPSQADESRNTGKNKPGCTTCDEAPLQLYAAMMLPAAPPQEEEESGGDSEDKNIINLKDKIRIYNLGPLVNHEGVDYAPTVSADGRTLFFVSNQPGSILNEDDDPTHDFWAYKKFHRLDTVFDHRPYNIDTSTALGKLGVNTPLHEGAASIAADRQSLYFTGCNRPDGLGSCDLYKTTIEGDVWGRPTNLGRNVNSKNFDSQPSIAPDQSRIYFVSTREGPNSDGDNSPDNFDIWYADWDADMEEWLPAKNLEFINTEGREASPFIAADNLTLFFASDGHKPNLGGLDFYYTKYDPATDSWGAPINLGEPINTDEDDYFITLPASGDIIYFSSRRTDITGFQGDLDVFMAIVPTFFRTILVKGTVVDECSGEFIPADISIRNPITGKVFTDNLADNHNEFEMIVSITDFGNPKDSINAVTLEISAENEKYGKKMKALRINRPVETIEEGDADTPFEEHFVKLTLGQKPILAAEIDEADYVGRTKSVNPEIAAYRGLVMEEYQTWDLYPLLNYIFFDIGSSKIPDRYLRFSNASQTSMFADTTIIGGTLDKYYHILNIYGYRMKKFKDAKIEIVGCNDSKSPEEKRPGLSKERADNVFNYLKDIWGIEESRMKLTYRNKPKVPSNLRDSLGIQENWRVEIHSDEWEIMKPVFDKDPKTFPQPETMNFVMTNGIEDNLITKRRIEIMHKDKMWKVLTDVGITDKKKNWDWKSENGKYPDKTDENPFIAKLIVTTGSGAECASDPIQIPVMQVTTLEKKVKRTGDSTLETYNLILFPFDKATVGKLNDRIMNDYVYERVLPSSVVNVIGHTDVVGLYEHNLRLSNRRANAVEKGIDRKTKRKYASLDKIGVGEEEPLYDNSLPEGRFYNRTVQVLIRTPVEAYEK